MRTGAPVVTGLDPTGRRSVEVALDGARWRSFPAEAVLAAGIEVGITLDRSRARTLRRETKHCEALNAATAALRHCDRASAAVDVHMARAGIAPAERRQILAALVRTGIVDDGRFAEGRARVLSERGAGDNLIAADLERQGVRSDVAHDVVAALEPELQRAGRIIARRGAVPRTARYLAQKGFTEDTILALVAEHAGEAVG